MEKIDRRGFLRLSGRVAAGVGTGLAMVPLGEAVDKEVGNVTGMKTGNAYLNQTIQEQCAGKSDQKSCAREYVRRPGFVFKAGVQAPFGEEIGFREFPSYIVSRLEQDEDPFITQFVGKGGYSMNRRELIAGSLSTLVFAAAHNITDNGIGYDTKTIPAFAVPYGFGLWYLQRKLGFVSNFLAHSVANLTSIFTS